MARKKMYSKKATIGFFLITAVLLSVFGLVSADTGLFKGQIALFTNKGLEIEYPELIDGTLCPQDSTLAEGADLPAFPTCWAAEFLITSQYTALDTTVLIQDPATQTVIAKYTVDLNPGLQVSIPFDGATCGQYGFDLTSSTYTKTSNLECPAGGYEFVVSGNSAELGLFAEAVRFALTK